MVTPFRSNPFEQQTQQFLAQLRSQEEQQRRDREARAARRRDIAIRNAKIREEQLKAAEKAQAEQLAIQQANLVLQDPTTRVAQTGPTGEIELTPTAPQPVPTETPQPEQRFQFGSFLGSGILENVAKAAVDAIEPTINTATGLVARALPGDQEFDKQFRQVMEEREEAGKPGGLRQFLAAGTEASRRASPLQRGAEIGVSTVGFPLLASLTPGDLFGVENQFQELREKYYEEETGEAWGVNSIKNMNADIRASRKAYQEIDMPKYVKGTLEFIFDPVNLIPYIGIVNDIKTTTRLLKATAVGGTRLGTAIPKAITGDVVLGRGAVDLTSETTAIRKAQPSVITAAVQNLKNRINFEKGVEPETFSYEDAVTAKQISETIKAREDFISLTGPNRDIVNAIETRFAVDPAVKPVATNQLFNLDTFNEVAVPLLDLEGATVLNKPGVYNTIITPYKLDWANNKTAKYYDETSEYKLGTVSEAMFGDNGQAVEILRTQQASTVQGWVRDSLNYLDKIDPTPVAASLRGVVNKISPKILVDLKRPNLNAERAKYATNKALATANAEATVNSVIANSGVAATVFGTKLSDSAIIEVSEQSGKAIRNLLRKRYNDAAKRAGIKADNVLASPEVSPNRFHETDLANAVVETIGIQNSQNVASNIYLGINKAFRYEGSEFWDSARNMPTRQGHYLIERVKAFTEMNKMLDETGIEIRTASGKVLTGMERVQHLLDEGAFVSRFVREFGEETATPTVRSSLQNYFTKARTLVNPYELVEFVQAGSVKYASPEDVLRHYTQRAYSTVVDKAFNVRLEKLFKENPELAERFGVSIVAEKAAGVQIVSDNNIPALKLKLANNDPLEPTNLNTLFESLVFKDEKLASRFAGQFDVLIDDPSNTWWANFKARRSRGGLLRGAEDLGRIFRMAGTGIDMGLLAIYGTIIFGKSNVDILRGIATDNKKLIAQGKDLNKALANATVDSFLALFSPENIKAKIYQDRALLEKASRSGLTLSKSSVEAFEALSVNGPITKFLAADPNSSAKGIKIYRESTQQVRKIFDRFENSWSTFIDSVKLDSFEALTKSLDEVTDADEIRQIADFINKGTGTLSSEAAGISTLQRQIETAFMFFSPRMTRSIIALLSDATTRGGVQGQLAREGALGAWMSLQAYTWGVGQLLGQDVNLDPSEPHYLQVKIGNSWVGPSGQIISVPRALYRAAAGPDDAAALYNDLDQNGDYTDSTWFRLIRERALGAPTGSIVANFITNEDYYGQPYENNLDFVTAQSRNLLPFWLQDVVAGDPYSTDAFATAAGFVGLRTRALTSYERRRLLLDSTAEEKYGVGSVKDLTPIQRKELYSDLESEDSALSTASDYQAVNAVIEEQRRKNGLEPTSVDLFYDRADELRTEKQAALNKLALQYETNPNMSPADFNEAIKDLNREYAPKYDELYDSEGKYSEALLYMKRRDALDETENLESMWVEAYKTQVLESPEFEQTNAAGITYLDFDARQNAERQFAADFGQDALEVARQYYETSFETHPVRKEAVAMRETFSWYYEVPKQYAIAATSRKYGMSIAQLEELWQLSRQGSSNQKRSLGTNPIVQDMENYDRKMKEVFRENNLALDIFLVRFGIGGVENFATDERKKNQSLLNFATTKTQLKPEEYASYGELVPSSLTIQG